MKRLLSLFLALCALAFLVSGCGGGTAKTTTMPEATPGQNPAQQEEIDLDLWVYPVGGLGSNSGLPTILSAFHRAHPEIRVIIHSASYETGDAEIEEAIANEETPDMVFEGPERLTANWGARGLMADLSDLWDTEAASQIYDNVAVACRTNDGKHYIYPICMTTHCMAINRDVFEAADAWQYVDEETHTWSTDGFISAVKKLYLSGINTVGEVYCGGQGGDQGTRALINNLYSGSFTTTDHLRYNFNSQENAKALQLLYDLDGIVFTPDRVGSDSITSFASGAIPMTFCWNVANEVSQVINNPNLNFDIFPMAFPTDNGHADLQGGVWGFGVFDNGDPQKIEAAKTLIRFLTEDNNQYTQLVLASTFWPVRDVANIYENDELMTEYFTLRQYLGDYYQVTPGWADARTAWWQMLQKVGDGEDIPTALQDAEDAANGAATS